jgi:hypothetical protein
MKINNSEFKKHLDAINCCYGESVSNLLPKVEDFPKEIYFDDAFDLDALHDLIKDISDCYLKSVAMRIVAISELRIARDSNIEVNLKKVWELIADSILTIPPDATISSIGSQGFLSIPLFKDDKIIENFDFIRLHIWDESLSQYIDQDKSQNFSIHNHSFYAKSWILCGKVVNDRFKVKEVSLPTDLSLFKVVYNKSLNKVNQHYSVAENKNKYVSLQQISHEEYMSGGYYSINAGDFHRSGSNGHNGFSATLFSFTAKDGRVEQSFVVGPTKSVSSKINRKMLINPIDLIKKINIELK